MKLSVVGTLLLGIGLTHSANILILLPLPFTSHILNFKPLFIELADRGHNVTYVSSTSLPETKNLHQTIIHVPTAQDLIEKMVGVLRNTDQWGFLTYFWKYGSRFIDEVLDTEKFQQLLHEDAHYDVIITEPYFLHEPLVVFGYKFNAPIVGLFPLSPTVWASYASGNPAPFSYVPSYKTPYSDQMSLGERVQNTILQLYEYVGSRYYYLPKQEEVVRKKMIFKGSENLPPLIDLLNNVSIHLIDYHYSCGYSRPFENNVLQVGGLSISRSEVEPIEKELLDVMNDSKGVIYFSLGGHMNPATLGENGISGLMQAFSELKDYQILMKWDEERPVYMPRNVYTSKWFPQPSILGHPKTKLMIGHGGLHGMVEAIHHGVPYISIPQFSDQESNTQYAISEGFGLRIGNDQLTSENIVQTINTLLTDPSFKENAMKMSKIEKDRVMKPLDLAVYGVEHVIRHKGAAHLRPRVLDLYWYQYLLVDVFLVILAVPMLVFFLLYKCAKFHRPSSPNPKKKKL